MNKCFLYGRLTEDPEARAIPSGVPCCKFTLAVDRPTKDDKADFFTIIAWRKTAEFVLRWIRKGFPVNVVGTIQTRTYDAHDGGKRYVTEIIAEAVEGVGGR